MTRTKIKITEFSTARLKRNPINGKKYWAVGDWSIYADGTATSNSRKAVHVHPRTGYHKLRLSSTTKSDFVYLHRLIYTLYIGIIPANAVVWHIDGDQSNNNPSNLICGSRAAYNRFKRVWG